MEDSAPLILISAWLTLDVRLSTEDLLALREMDASAASRSACTVDTVVERLLTSFFVARSEICPSRALMSTSAALTRLVSAVTLWEDALRLMAAFMPSIVTRASLRLLLTPCTSSFDAFRSILRFRPSMRTSAPPSLSPRALTSPAHRSTVMLAASMPISARATRSTSSSMVFCVATSCS